MKKYELNQDLNDVGLGNETLTDFGLCCGYHYFLALNQKLGTTNGYVIIEPKQAGYDYKHDYQFSSMDCHGGITFDEYDTDDERVIGFDTAHVGDYIPKLDDTESRRTKKVWDDMELIEQCYMIINQLRG